MCDIYINDKIVMLFKNKMNNNDKWIGEGNPLVVVVLTYARENILIIL